jgi:hypothetical protein
MSQNKAIGWERQDWDDLIEELLTPGAGSVADYSH